MPGEWSVQPLDQAGKPLTCAFVKVNRHTQEFRDATKNFGKTMTSNFHIITVQRVQNPQEYCRYLGLKATWQSSGRYMIEKELFHGTKRDSISPICATGFNRIFAADVHGTYTSYSV